MYIYMSGVEWFESFRVLITMEWFGHAIGTFIKSVCRYKEVQEFVAVAVAGCS